ncbi:MULTISPECIES: CPCC family cysteine-rich protein [unclassified Pseudoalteromonas]|uniref:CPCC family cysteine-rich protein n=1 Tax=unclassified Pseudoalteromonas TaxID=194690 RepID=UPI001601142F|nr:MULTISPECIES: CPCC family cysteine-rich protein [unclassified Pseudoalteromonas]MBB1335773.1 hypothetical protein [Pseudoalteromonas sp. SR41-6]MBB1342624.1 hypothetical protein [Pseudoalteromonas sp. SR45-6]MBB1434936.1 hypothetical protein [Pseudoalteromonas sp. SG43-6]MBB1461049.1 hypothetical protein [Pseudoalteromonas sp. SG41-8]
MSKQNNPTVDCPCCGYITLKYGGCGEICEVCFWEYDSEIDSRVTIPSVCNHGMTLNEAKENFELFGATKEEFIKHVVPFEARKLYQHINKI